MAAAPPTISSWKIGFLNSQASHLSKPLSPSIAWQQGNRLGASHDGETTHLIPSQIVVDAIHDVNVALDKHSKRVYPPQATGHVAVQISKLYRIEAEHILAKAEPQHDAQLSKYTDFAEAQAAKSLPPAWPSGKDSSAYPAEAKRYEELATRLHALGEECDALLERTQRLRQMKDLIEPLSSPGSIQENLITKHSAVEKELERTRMLLLRVSGRTGALRPALDTEVSQHATTVVQQVGTREVDLFLADGSVFPA